MFCAIKGNCAPFGIVFIAKIYYREMLLTVACSSPPSLRLKKRTRSYEDLGRKSSDHDSQRLFTQIEEPSKGNARPRSFTYDGSPIKEIKIKPPILVGSSIASTFLSINVPVPLRVRSGSYSDDAAVPVNNTSSMLKGLTSLRNKSDNHGLKSSSSNSGIASMTHHNSSSINREEVESADKWRDRIWPTKAIFSFCRAITRCKPPAGLVPGKRIAVSSRSSGFGLEAHWSQDSLCKIPLTFDSALAHSSSFFLHAVEECRESATVQDTLGDGPSDRNIDSDDSHGWSQGEVVSIVSETERGRLPLKCDPRLGSVWIVRVRRTNLNPSSSFALSSTVDSQSNISELQLEGEMTQALPPQNLPEISGGDLLVLLNPNWSRPILAVAQGWDPDLDLKLSGPRNEDGREFVNIMVCVDQGTPDGAPLGMCDIGGWVGQGIITVGLNFQMVALGNMLTSIRECQALMSLRVLNKPLQQVILRAGQTAEGAVGCSAIGADVQRDLISNTGGISANFKQRPKSSNIMPFPSDFAPGHPQFSPPPANLNPPKALPVALWDVLKAQYNSSQLRAIRAVCFDEPGAFSESHSVFSLLQGPPGTGKTRTILAIIAVLLAGGARKTRANTKVLIGTSLRNQGKGGSGSVTSTNNSSKISSDNNKVRILVCAPSNTAVDEIVFRLKTQGVLGPDGTRREDLQVIRIGQAVGSRSGWKHNGEMDAGSIFSSGAGGGRTLSAMNIVERCTLDYLVEEKRKLCASEAKSKFESGRGINTMDIRKGLLESAHVVCCTLSGAGSQPILEVVMRIPGFKFDAVIIDEAAQAVEPSTLIPLKYNPQTVVMVGDPCQLPATLFSKSAKEANYGQSLFQRLNAAGYPMNMLETQYRMHQDIAAYPSYRFYAGKLRTDPALIASKSHAMPYHEDKSGKFRPFVLHNLSQGRQQREGDSMRNDAEVLYVARLFEALVTQYPDHKQNVGIIAPYRAQRRAFKNLFRDRWGGRCDVEISTIDGFQGREKDIVIFSCVRAPNETGPSAGTEAEGASSLISDRGIGFLREWQRLNVAITRAKYAMWIVGHVETLQQDPEWSQLIEFSMRRNYIFQVPSSEGCENRRPEHRDRNARMHSGGRGSGRRDERHGQGIGRSDHERGRDRERGRNGERSRSRDKRRDDYERGGDRNRGRRDDSRDRGRDRNRRSDSRDCDRNRRNHDDSRDRGRDRDRDRERERNRGHGYNHNGP